MAILAEGRRKAEEVLNEEQAVFDEIVEKLMKKVYSTGAELRAIWNKHHK